MLDLLVGILHLVVFPGGLFALALGLFLKGCDRRVEARLQRRVGPPLIQPFLDLVKLSTKEVIIPTSAVRGAFLAAPVVALGGIAMCAALLPVPGVTDGLPKMGDLLVIFYIALGCWRAAPVTRLLLRSAQNHLDLETNQTMGHFFENIFHALVGLFAGIAMLDRLGVPVSGLLTGAGVAGLAVSLAAQSTLNSLIAGITLVLERPFGIGDYIVLGDCEGTVEDISFRSTRIRSPDNVAITIENSKITAEYIQNYDRRQSRLWKFTIGLTYDTPREKIEQLTADLTAMLQAQPDVQPDGVTIALDKFNDYSIDLACRVYITKVNLRDFMQVKNTLNLQILDLMKEEGKLAAFLLHQIQNLTTTVDLPERK